MPDYSNIEDRMAALSKARANLERAAGSSVSPNPEKRGNTSIRTTDPDGYRKMTSTEQFFKGVGDIGDAIQEWDPFGIGTFSENWEKTKDNWKTGNGSLEQGVKTVGSFLWSLPTGMFAAPFSGVEKLVGEGILGNPTSEATDDGWIPNYDMTTGQRWGAALDGAIDLVGTFLGGTGRLAKGGYRLAKGASLGDAFASKTGKEIMKEAAKGAEWGTDAYKAASRGVTARAMAGDMLEEGSEEFLQSIFGDIRGDQSGSKLDNESLARALEAFGLGAAGGAVFSGVADFGRRMGERIDHAQGKAASERAEAERQSALASMPDMQTFTSIRQDFDIEKDSPYISDRLWKEVSEQEQRRAAISRYTAASFTATSSKPLDLELDECDISFAELKFGILADVQKLKDAIAARQTAEEDPNASAQGALPDVEVNDVSKNFGLTPEQVLEFEQVCLQGDDAGREWLQKIVNSNEINVIVEKNPAFNRGPFQLRIRKILPGAKQISINALEMSELNGDYDGDAITAWYGKSVVDSLSAAGARANASNYRGLDYESWGGISRATFWGNGRNRTSAVIDTVSNIASQIWSEFSRSNNIQENLLSDVESIVKKRLTETGSNLSGSNRDKRRNLATSSTADFNEEFGNALEEIKRDVRAGLSAWVNEATTEEDGAYRRSFAASAARRITNAVLQASAISEQRRAIFTSYVSAVTGGIEGVPQDQLETMSIEDAINQLRDNEESVEYIKTKISSGTVMRSSIRDVDFNNINDEDALTIFMIAGYFDPYVDESLQKANPIFRSAGHFVMMSQGAGNIQIAPGEEGRFWKNFFTAAILSAVKINGFGENAVTIAKTFVKENVVANLKRELEVSKIGMSGTTIDAFQDAFIKAYNKTSNAFNDAANKYIKQEAVVLNSLVDRSRPGEATDKNWIQLFADTFGDTTWGELFDYSGEYANDTISKTLEDSFARVDVDILQEIANEINDGNDEGIRKFIMSLRNVVREKNVRLEDRLWKAKEKDDSAVKLFQRSPELVKKYNEARTDSERHKYLRLLINDIDSLLSLFGVDVMRAMGWLSSTNIVDDPYYLALINATTQDEWNNAVFAINLYANMKPLLATSESKDHRGFFQILSDSESTSEEKLLAYQDMMNYLMSLKDVSDIYRDLFRKARELYDAAEFAESPIETAASGFMKIMENLLSLDHSFDEKERIPGMFPGVYETTADGSRKKVRSLVIEAMANRKTKIDDIGIGTRIERANQTSSAKVYTRLEKSSENWDTWSKRTTEENKTSRLNWIKTRLEYATTKMSSSFLSLMIRDAASLPSRDRSEKVKTTDAQALMYSAVRIANAPAFETAFDQLSYNVSNISHAAAEVATNPILLSRILADPTVEIPVCTSHGAPSMITGKEVWSWLIDEEFEKDEPEWQDYDKLFRNRPALLDMLCDKEIVGVKSGDMSTSQFVISGDDFVTTGDFDGAMERDQSGDSDFQGRLLKNEVSRILLSNKKFLTSLVYYIGDDITKRHTSRDFSEIVNKAFEEIVDWFSYILVSETNQRSTRQVSTENALASASDVIPNTRLNEFFDGLRTQVVSKELDNLIDALSIFDQTGSDELAQYNAELTSTITSQYRSAISDVVLDLVLQENEPSRQTGSAEEEVAAAANSIRQRIEEATRQYNGRIDSVEAATHILQGMAEDTIRKLFELPHIIRESMPAGFHFEPSIISQTLDSPLTMEDLQESAERLHFNGEVTVDMLNRANETSIRSELSRLMANEYDTDLDILFGIFFRNPVLEDARHSAVQESTPQEVTDLSSIIANNRQEIFNIIRKHLPASYIGGDNLLSDAELSVFERISDIAESTNNRNRFKEEVSSVFFEYRIRDAKVSGQGLLNNQIGLAARNYYDGFVDAYNDLVDNIDTRFVSVPKPEYSSRFGGQKRQHGITSASVHLVANTLNDLLTGADVSMRTGMEGDAYKTWLAFGCLPTESYTNTPNDLNSCHAEPDVVTAQDLSTADMRNAVYQGLIRIDGADHQLTIDEYEGILSGYADYLASEQPNETAQERAARIPTYTIHDSRKCHCGGCAKHPVRNAMRALYDAASFASEDMTIQARKKISFASSEIIKTIGRDRRQYSARKRTGEVVRRDPIYIVHQDESFDIANNPVLSVYSAFNTANLDQLSKDIKNQISNDSKLSEGWSGLERSSWFVASIMTNYVSIMATDGSENAIPVQLLFTRDEILSGVADRELGSRGLIRVVGMQQHYLTLDQAARRILFYIDSKRREAVSDPSINWNDLTSKEKIDLVNSWAIEAMQTASDTRENNVEQAKEDFLKAISDMKPTPRHGEIISTFNSNIFSDMFYDAIGGNAARNTFSNQDVTYSGNVRPATINGTEYNFMGAFWYGRTPQKPEHASEAEVYSGVEGIINSIEQANIATNRELPRVISAENEKIMIPSENDILLYVNSGNIVPASFIERVAACNSNGRLVMCCGDSVAYSKQIDALRMSKYATAIHAIRNDNTTIIEIDLSVARNLDLSMYDSPYIPGADIVFARRDNKTGKSEQRVTFSMLDTYIRYENEDRTAGYVGNIFGGTGDSAELIFSNSAKSIGAVWSQPIEYGEIPFKSFRVCQPSDFAAIISDDNQLEATVDNLWRNFLRQYPDVKKQEGLYKQAFRDFLHRNNWDSTTIETETTCVGIIGRTANGVTEYFPIIPRRRSNTLVGATIENPTKIAGKNAVSLKPVHTYIKGLDEGGSIKFYNANLIYKAQATAGIGEGYFYLGKQKWDLEGVQQKSALDTRLLGVWDDLVSAVTMYHLYQRHAIEKAAEEGTDITIGNALRNIMSDAELANPSLTGDIADLNNTGSGNGFNNTLLGNKFVNKILERKVSFKNYNGIPAARYARIFQQLFVNCKKIDANPAVLFNFTHDDSILSLERNTTGWDSAIFSGLSKDDVHVLFNVLDTRPGDSTGMSATFCPNNSMEIVNPRDNNRRWEVVRGGEVLCEIQIPDPTSPDKMIQTVARRRIFWPLSLSNGTSTYGQTVSDSVQMGYARNIGLALRYGLRPGLNIDACLDWAISENGGIVDDWVTSWVSGDAGITDSLNDYGAANAVYRNLYSEEEQQQYYDSTQQAINVTRATEKYMADSYYEDLASMMPVQIRGKDKDAAMAFKLRLIAGMQQRGATKRPMPVTVLDQTIRSISGTSKDGDTNENFDGMSEDQYSKCVAALEKALLDPTGKTNPFSARGQLYYANGNARYSMCIAPRSVIKWFANNTNWNQENGHPNESTCVEQCINEAAAQKKNFLTVTSKDRDLLRKVRAIEKRINYLMYLNGKPVDEILCMGVTSYDEMSRTDYEFFAEINGFAELGGTRADFEEFKRLVEHTQAAIAMQQQRAKQSGTKKAEAESLNGGSDLYFSAALQNKEIWQALKTASTLSRAMSLLTIELPVNAAIDKGANYGLMLIASRLADKGFISPYDASKSVKVDPGVIRAAASNPQLNALLNGMREAQVNNMLPQFLDYITKNDVFSLDGWYEFIEKNMQGNAVDKNVNKAYRKIARFATAEGAFNTWRNELFLRRLCQIAGADWAEDLKSSVPAADGGTHTRLEAALINNPALAIAELLNNESSPHYMHVLRAFNGALKGDMAQDTLVSAFWNYIAQKHVGLDFLMTTFACKFVRASTAFTHRVLNSIAPMSAIHYVLTQWAANRTWGNKVKALEGFEFEAERVQAYSSLKEAIAVDMAHMSMTAVAAILVCTAGGIEPPEDPDKWKNEDEWTVMGMRISTNWWLRDIFGLTLPLAITIKSAMLGKPQLDTLTASLAEVVTSNPFLKIGDVVGAVLDPSSQFEEFDSAVDMYSDYPGGAPNLMEYILGSKKAFGLSYLGQFITPNFVKELTRTLPEYEHSYNQIFVDDLVGSDYTDIPRTQRTTFEDAQIRKVTRGNAFLGLIMNMLPNDSKTGYQVWEMPRQYIIDPYQYQFMDAFDVRDDNGNLKSETEIQAICYEVVSMLASTDDMDSLYKQGFYLNYETKAYIADLLSDLRVYAKEKFAQTTNDTNGLDPYVLGFGSELLGKQTAQEIVDGYNEFQQLMEDCYQKLWSDDLNQGLTYYNRYNTTWAEDAKGNWYATGYKEGLGSIFMPFLLAPTNSTVTGKEGDWATISAVTGGGMYDDAGNGIRALIPKTLKDYGNTDEDGNVTYSDLYKLLWGKNGIGYANSSYSSGSGYGYSRSSSYRPAPPNIYSPNTSGSRYLNGPANQDSGTRPVSSVDLEMYYLRPGFETKGSRKAYRREDI